VDEHDLVVHVDHDCIGVSDHLCDCARGGDGEREMEMEMEIEVEVERDVVVVRE
jgi:hypothetical protein